MAANRYAAIYAIAKVSELSMSDDDLHTFIQCYPKGQS